MKHFAKLSLFFVAAASVFLAGCAHTPTRPTPAQTVMGPPVGNGGGGNRFGGGTDVNTSLGNGLNARPDNGGFDDNSMMRGETVGLISVSFAYDQSNIAPEERAKVTMAVKYLQDHPELHMMLEGHCDWRGTAEYNLALGDRRAAAVKKFMQDAGIAVDRLETLSKGSLDAPKNADEAQMKKDRRVDFVLVKK